MDDTVWRLTSGVKNDGVFILEKRIPELTIHTSFSPLARPENLFSLRIFFSVERDPSIDTLWEGECIDRRFHVSVMVVPKDHEAHADINMEFPIIVVI